MGLMLILNAINQFRYGFTGEQIIMLGNLLKLAGVSVLAGGYYVHQYNRVRLNNPWMQRLFATIESHKPKYSQSMFKILLRLGFMARQESLGKYIMKGGFDGEGNYLDALQELGFGGVEVGPTSYNASLEEDPEFYLGINNVIANICTFQARNSSAFQIQIGISPNHEVLKYTPYLLKQNICEALKNYIEMQKLTHKNIADSLNFDVHRGSYRLEEDNAQAKAMISQLKEQCRQLTAELNKTRTRPIRINFAERKEGYLEWSRLLAFILGHDSL